MLAYLGGVPRSDGLTALAFALLAAAVSLTLRVFWQLPPARALRVNLACLLLLLASPLLVAAATLPTRRGNGPTRPKAVERVVLITIDAQRADDLTCYDARGTPTPGIDGLARDGVLFENAYASSPWTQPSVASILTGLSPWSHGIVDSIIRLPEGVATLAERFAEQGYATAGFTANAVLADPWGFSQGFDEFHGFPKPWLGGSIGARIADALRGSQTTPALQTDLVLRWLDAHPRTPFFLWVHYLDPHLPYAPPPDFLPPRLPGSTVSDSFGTWSRAVRVGDVVLSPLDQERVRSLYRAETRSVDWNVGRLLDRLREHGLYDGSLIVLSADHGEEFWEHDGFEHGHTLYDEVLRVPLLVKPPFARSGTRIAARVGTQSIAATLLELAGIPSAPAASPSLAPLLGGAGWTPTPLVATGLFSYENREAVIVGDWKYIRSVLSGKEELFDLARDPGERHSLVKERPEILAKAQATLEAERRRATAHAVGDREAATELDEGSKARLRALGYAD
jgi:arylsulfatase